MQPLINGVAATFAVVGPSAVVPLDLSGVTGEFEWTIAGAHKVAHGATVTRTGARSASLTLSSEVGQAIRLDFVKADDPGVRGSVVVASPYPNGFTPMACGEVDERGVYGWTEAVNDALGALRMASPDGRFGLTSLQPQSRQGTAALANGATATIVVPCASNNRIHRTTWALRVKVGGLNTVCDYYTVSERDGAGIITRKDGQFLGTAAPPFVAVAWATAANEIRLQVTNTTGGPIEVWCAPSDMVEDVS